MLTLLALAGGIGPPVHARAATQVTWTGAGPDAKWTDALNWLGGLSPSPGDALVFPGNASQFSPVNDEPAGIAYASLTLGSVYQISGNALSLSNGISAVTGSGSRLSLPLTFLDSQVVSAGTWFYLYGPVSISSGILSFAGGTTDVVGTVSGGGGITVSGSATVSLFHDDTYMGPTLVQPGGTLVTYSSLALGSAAAGTTVDGGGALRMEGTAPPCQEPITLDTTTGTGAPVLFGVFLDLTGALTLLGAGQVEIGRGSGGVHPDFRIDGPVSGSAALLIIGSLELTNASNSLTGAITVGQNAAASYPQDFLAFDTPGALGTTSQISLAGGELEMCATGAVPCAITPSVTVDGGVLTSGTGTTGTLLGSVAIASHGATFEGASVTGKISGSGPVDIRYGQNSFSGSNTFAGPITVEVHATLHASGDGALGPSSNAVTINGFGRIQLAGATSLGNNLTLNGAYAVLEVMCADNGACGTVTLSGTATVEGSQGTGTILCRIVADAGETAVITGVLQGDAQQQLYLGGDGLVDIPGPQSFPGILFLGRARAGGPTSVDSAAAVHALGLQIDGSKTFTVPLYGPGLPEAPGLENLSGDTTWTGPTFAPYVTVDSGSVSFTNVLSDPPPGNPTGLTKDGPGLLTLTGTSANTNTGVDSVLDGTLDLDKPTGFTAAPAGVTVGQKAPSSATAVVQLQRAAQLGSQADVGLLTGGTLDLNGFSDTVRNIYAQGGALIGHGGSLTLDGNVSVAGGSVTAPLVLSSGTHFVSAAIYAARGQPLAAAISGSGGVTVNPTSSPIVVPSGTVDSYTGGTDVEGGLEVDGSVIGSPVSVRGYLSGTGITAAVSVDGYLAPGVFEPSVGFTGNLTVASASLHSGSSLDIIIGGWNSPCSSCTPCASCTTQVTSMGTVDLSASPRLSVDSYGGAKVGSTWTIVDNRSGAPVLGTFSGLPEGAAFTDSSGDEFQITYRGGSAGKSVVLTVVSPSSLATTTTSIASSVNPAAAGQTVTYTATVAPSPDGGTVSFSDQSAAINGCTAVAVTGGQAKCSATYDVAGTHHIAAAYSGDSAYGSSGSTVLAQTVNPPGAQVYVPLASPQRLEDTRDDGRTLAAGGSIDVQVAGGSTGVPSNATAVVINVTSVNNAGSGYLQVFPHGGSTGSSAVNFYYPNQLTQDLVTAPVDPSTGQITIRGSVRDDVVVDEFGYYLPSSGSTGGQYVALAPHRLCDTRAASSAGCVGGPVRSGGVVHLKVGGNGGVPSTGVSAVVLNVTVADDTLPGFVQAYAHGTARPAAPATSNVNYNGAAARFAGDPCGGSSPQSNCQIIANRVIVPVDASGGVDLYVNQGPIDIIVDVNGYFTSGSASSGRLFTPTPVTRVHDTRTTADTLSPYATMTLPLTGTGNSNLIPTGASSAVLTVTIDKTTPMSSGHPYNTGASVGFITVYPGPGGSGQPPLASDLNFPAESIVPAEVYATLGPDGTVNIYNGSPSAVDVIVDVYGYFK